MLWLLHKNLTIRGIASIMTQKYNNHYKTDQKKNRLPKKVQPWFPIQQRLVCKKADFQKMRNHDSPFSLDWFVPNTLLHLNTNLFNYISLL